MKESHTYCFFFFLVSVLFFSHSISAEEVRTSSLLGNLPDGVIMTVGEDSVWLSDFAYIYKKNKEEAVNADKSLDEYVDLFTVFQLKVHEAKMQGIDTTESFRREFRSYRSQATVKYMRDDATLDSLVQVGYDRMSRDRRASHIAISCPANANDSARTIAWENINAVRKLVVENKNRFAEIATEESDDPNAKQNAGDLGWIRPYRYVYAFEEAVYNTPVGEISSIFQTPFGYHIVKVDEELDHVEINARHIMKIFNKDDENSIEESREKIDSLYKVLQSGADFADVAKRESDDKGSANRGGELGWFGRGMMVKAFEDVAFQTSINQMSEPFQSDYGWHVLYKVGQRPMLPLDSMRKQILNNIERDERMKIADSIFIRKMRTYYNLPDSLSHSDVRKYVDEHLEERYEDFRHIVKEYHDGIMLFEVSLGEVWNKASADTTGLQRYFEANRTKYQWKEPKFKGFVVQCKDEHNAKLVDKIIKNNIKRAPDSILSYVNSIVNVDTIPYVEIRRSLWGKGENALVDRDIFGAKDAKVNVSKEFPVVFARGKKIKAAEDFRDVRTDVVSDYQDELEKHWVAELKRKYPVKINRQLLEQYRDFLHSNP